MNEYKALWEHKDYSWPDKPYSACFRVRATDYEDAQKAADFTLKKQEDMLPYPTDEYILKELTLYKKGVVSHEESSGCCES